MRLETPAEARRTRALWLIDWLRNRVYAALEAAFPVGSVLAEEGPCSPPGVVDVVRKVTSDMERSGYIHSRENILRDMGDE